MSTFSRVQGDVNDTATVTLSGVEDLTAASSVEAHVWKLDVAAETLTATITDTTARTVEVDLGGTTGWLSDAAAGRWLVEYQVTFTDGTILTWPAGTPDTITVRAQGA